MPRKWFWFCFKIIINIPKFISMYSIGVDVGGTNIKFGLVNARGVIVVRTRLATKALISSRKKMMAAIIDKIQELMAAKRLTRKNVRGIGFGFPGLVDPKQGKVIFLPNIPGWKNVPLRNLIEKSLKIPVFLDNDVNLITLGEWRYGAGRGVKNLICVTLGTGVGAGLILDSTLYRGEGFVAGEIGHMPLNEKGPKCSCGGEACFERYVGNKETLRLAKARFKKSDLALEGVYALGVKGNVSAIKFWEDFAARVGRGLVGAVNLLNPRLIILGGGVSNSYRLISKTILKTIKARSMKVQGRMIKIARAKLGDDAGIIGAHVLVNASAIKG